MDPRPFDLVLFGATGFTGRLVAEVLQSLRPPAQGLAWALAGRDLARLAEVRRAIGASDELPLLRADATDASALARLAAQARVVITTAGPYQRHGEALVEACARAGTDYVDLCGEPAWMARMIPRLQPPAQASGARIVFSCGFDSIPSDLGVVFLQHEAMRRWGQPLVRVAARVMRLRGGLSGGTLASGLATLEAAAKDEAVARTIADPFALTPGFSGPPQPDAPGACRDELAGDWSAPFLMAPINTKNVHRTNALRGHPWGRDFVYGERLHAPNAASAWGLAAASRTQTALLAASPARRLLQRWVFPAPGEGPGPTQRQRGSWALRFTGRTADGRTLAATVDGSGDPGYGSTSRMLVQSALCLALDIDRSLTPGGVWTPGAAMGLALVHRLQAEAGLRFSIET